MKSGNIFLRLLCLDLLVEEARLDARTHFQQRAHLKVRGHYCLEADLLTANVKKWMFPLKCFFFGDEGLHTDFACLMFRHLVNKPTKERILEVEFFIYFINFFDDQV